MNIIISNRFYQAIIACSIAIMPYSVVRALTLGASVLCSNMGWASLAGWLDSLQNSIFISFPLVLNIMLSLHWSARSRIPAVQAIVSSLFALFLVNGITSDNELFFLNIDVPIALGVALLTNWSQEKIAYLLPPTHADNGWCQIGYSVIQFGGSILAVLLVFYPLLSLHPFDGELIRQHLYPSDLWHGLLYELARGFTWFLGLHGHYVFQDLGLELFNNTQINFAAWQAGLAPLTIINSVFYDVWCSIGGAGCTLSLLLCLLIRRHRAHRRLLGAALPLGLFNINEPVIYGVPILLNPIMLLPFLLTPLLSFVVAYYATLWQLVPPMQELVPWVTPPLLSAWIGSGGSWAAVLLQLVIIALGVACYYPFIRYLELRTFALERVNMNANSPELSIPVDIALIPSHQHLTDFDAIQEARKQITKLHASGEFVLYFQPQVSLKTKKISGLEVLIRHRSHEGKITPPIFLQHYERLGLMIELDFWVIAKSIEHIRLHMPMLEDDMMLSINVSPQTLLDPRLSKIMAEALAVPLPARWALEFEITESAQLVDHARVSTVLADLGLRGIKVALDDFGSGYSTLSYLTRYSLDKIKLDRTLVQGLQANNGIEFFNQVVSLCRIGQAQVLVEGVETEEELSHMFSAGVDSVQGYFFYRPLPLDEVTRLLRESKEDDRIPSFCASA